MSAEHSGYQYVVLRCVPRVDREEFVNVGVVVYCQARDFLRSASRVDAARLRAVGGDRLDAAEVEEALAAIEAVCVGDGPPGSPASEPIGTRFGFVSAPRSTVVQPGPIHGGVADDPERELADLLDRLVG
ncbi:MAG TPA: DUF3037 domain-containing protein [Nocardioidaceae bacterium]|nr:DUF3037 domain-containing protein [Nocardioidaceae bacterium]